eukprot:240166-Alexandrium_andersonii.AAC.1
MSHAHAHNCTRTRAFCCGRAYFVSRRYARKRSRCLSNQRTPDPARARSAATRADPGAPKALQHQSGREQ